MTFVNWLEVWAALFVTHWIAFYVGAYLGKERGVISEP